MSETKFYGVLDLTYDEQDWLRDGDSMAVLAFESKREACEYAAKNWGFPTYTAAKRAGWCEVKPLTK